LADRLTKAFMAAGSDMSVQGMAEAAFWTKGNVA